MSKPAVVFVHGFRGAGVGLVEVANFLSDYECFIPDLPPTNNQKMQEYSLENYAEFLKDFLKKNNIKKPILVGHSMGSVIAAYAAYRDRDLFDNKIILISPIIKKPAFIIKLLQPLILLFPSDWISFVVTKFFFVKKDKKIFKNALELTRLCASKYESRLELFKNALFASTHGIEGIKLSKDILLIVGENDRIVAKKIVKAYASGGNAKINFVENTGHIVNYEAPKTVANLIKDFLIG